jgi:(p)ppGpp synthase/HD superfamily hydrolase
MSASPAQQLAAAVALAAEVHHGQTRDEGTPYIEHPIRVARIAALEARLDDPALIAAAYLHDTLEDAAEPEAVRARIRAEFGARVLGLVETLTKPAASVPKEQRDREYHARLLAAAPEVQALKLADRLDNVRSLVLCPDVGKRASYLKETEAKYLPLAEQTGVLLDELRLAMERVRTLDSTAGEARP